ncbi:MAG: SEC-C metal-binding domain-containing protein, partial [Candidatus Shapirobacteria bacterium]|nr:SEC-C metal-binding domain-containing protein [Candidatus Shapirobacteria bacterium]
FGGEQIARLMGMLKIPEDQPIEHGLVSKAIQQAQVKVEGFNFDMRKHVVEYDDVMNKQREIIYGKRQKILQLTDENNSELKEQIQNKMASYLANLVNMYTSEDFEKTEVDQIINGFCEILPIDPGSQSSLKNQFVQLGSADKIIDFLTKTLLQAYDSREKQIGHGIMREIEKFVWLQSIDRLWIGHLDAMDDLREGVGLRGYGQQDPLVEYKKEAFASFEKLMAMIENEVIRRVFRVQVAQPSVRPQRIQTNIDTQDNMGLKTSTSSPVTKPSGKRLGRNDPCWCGSGKKWKKCHYPQLG